MSRLYGRFELEARPLPCRLAAQGLAVTAVASPEDVASRLQNEVELVLRLRVPARGAPPASGLDPEARCLVDRERQ